VAAWLLALPLALVPAACGDTAGERAALRDGELERELDLVVRGDTAPAVLADEPADMAQWPGPAARVEQVPAPGQYTAPALRQVDPVTVPQYVPQHVPAPAATPRVLTATAGIGTSMSITLNQTLSTETNVAGDVFTATLQHDVTDASGTVVIPAGATIRGRLTQVEKSGHAGATGIIKLAFEAVSFDGTSYPLDATVVRASPQRQNRTAAAEQAAKIGTGAAAGAVLGRVIGGSTRAAVRGAAVGAAAGTAIAMGTADVDVVLPEGSEMVIRLDSPVEVGRET
jgi:hypothetical protein